MRKTVVIAATLAGVLLIDAGVVRWFWGDIGPVAGQEPSYWFAFRALLAGFSVLRLGRLAICGELAGKEMP